MSLPISDSESDQVSAKLGPVILLGSSLSRRQVQSGGKEDVQAEETVSHRNLAYRPPHLWGGFPIRQQGRSFWLQRGLWFSSVLGGE